MKTLTLILTILGVLYAGGNSVRAEEDLFDTKAAAVSLDKGISFLKAKKYDAAVKEFQESVSIAPDAEGFYYLGYAYYLKGRMGDSESRKKSMENFEKAYELEPNFTPTRFKPAEAVPVAATINAVSQESPKHPASAPTLTSEPTDTKE